jgi:hypothetical protein
MLRRFGWFPTFGRLFGLSLILVSTLFIVMFSFEGAIAAVAKHRPAVATVRLSGHQLPALSKATPISSRPSASSQPMTLTIVLNRDDQAGFDRYLHDVYDRKSKIFRRFLTQKQIADRFGPSRHDYDSLIAYLRRAHLHVVDRSKNRLTLTVSGTRAQVERAFDVPIRDYKLGDRMFYANDGNPALPRELASSVQAVQGLSDLARPRPVIQPILDAFFCKVNVQLGNLFRFSNLGLNECQILTNELSDYKACLTAKNVPQILNDGWVKDLSAQIAACKPTGPGLELTKTTSQLVFDGSGQKIGLLEFDAFHQSDIADFLALIGYPSTVINNLSEVKVNGGASIGAYEDEVLLDTDSVLTIVPGAQVVVYDSPFSAPGTSFQAMFNKMMNDGDTVISNSWFYCESQTNAADVNSIDSILATAQGSGISIFNATGDTGNLCGVSGSIVVPGDSPHGTAVGGTTLKPGVPQVYSGETWWDSSSATPPGGQGGYGISEFFSRPSYQNGLNPSAMRSIPDLVLPADPGQGVQICQADAGGCPTGLLYGGTSNAAPIMAAVAAQLNQALGHNIGDFNTAVYPFANTAFHDAAALTSDFAHVGLGSPNIDALEMALTGQAAGLPDATQSQVGSAPLAGGGIPTLDPADGAAQAVIVVKLLDANDHVVANKTVSLSANGGAHADISPSQKTDANGNAVFTVTDLTAEPVTITATDTDDSVTLNQTVQVGFLVPPASLASFDSSPGTVIADGVTQSQLTVTLEDSLHRPTPGKQIQITQDGNSVITGPNPPVTDSNGMIQFDAVDNHDEIVTYTAVDVTDGNLPFPTTAQVTFSSSPAPGCVPGNPTPAPGFVVVPVATGFQAANFSAGGVSWGACPGAFGPAFDAMGNMYVSDFVDGNLYKFPPTGGVAGPATKLASIGATLGQPVFSGGNLYVTQAAVSGGQSQILQIDPSTGATLKTVIAPSPTGLICAEYLAADPLSGDLFSDNVGCGCNGAVWRVSNPGGVSPSLSTYATMPGCPNYALSFLPNGTLYVESDGPRTLQQVSGTNVTPTTVTTAWSDVAGNIGASLPALGLAAAGSGSGSAAQYLIYNEVNPSGPNAQTAVVDLTTTPPSIASVLTSESALGLRHLILGPDGCLYGTGGTAVFKITDSTGACTYTTTTQTLSLQLNPPSILPNPAQGTAQTFTASFHYGSVPDGTPIILTISGANPQMLQSSTVNNSASFTYTAINAGVDNLVAGAVVGSNGYTSNSATVTYVPGMHATFLTLNLTPATAPSRQSFGLKANLTDRTANPPTPISGQTVNFSLNGNDCGGTTDANGNVTCNVTPGSDGLMTLTANFAGAGEFLASHDSKDVNVIALMPTPTATPTPEPGKLKITPSHIKFGSVDVGSNKTKPIKIINAGKTTKKKMAEPIVIEMEQVSTTANPSPFTVTQCAPDDQLDPKSKGQSAGSCTAMVTFAPTAAGKFSGTLDIFDNVDPSLSKKYPNFEQHVPITGEGKMPK